MSNKHCNTIQHIPVLENELIDSLSLKHTDICVDATTGVGGHGKKILDDLDGDGIYIGIDLDGNALKVAEETLQKYHAKKCFVETNFRNIRTALNGLGIEKVDKVIADLGWGSYHLTCGRGFSFQTDEPLNMQYATKTENKSMFTARTILNTWDENHLADILWGYGEERWSRRIAKRILACRDEKPIETAGQLADIVAGAIPRRFYPRHIHVATKTFQALRIAVNDEIGALHDFLAALSLECVQAGGRVGIITFHSIEDRIVKRAFVDWERRELGKRFTKRPIRPSVEECTNNPRARSAKLRTFIF